MVDISEKLDTERVALAKAEVVFPEEIYPKILSQDVPKGDFLTCAKVARILGAKKTSKLIPLCHPLSISKVDMKIEYIPEKFALEITGKVKTSAKTEVEMEALMAVSITALTIYDICKFLHKDVKTTNICLVYKKGSKSRELILKDT